MSEYIYTYTGKQFYPLNPWPGDIDIEDIAHALSMQCRFTGHTNKFYSVAEHSVHVSDIVADELKLHALLHDASEAYLVDVSRPVKYSGHMDGYLDAEENLSKIIYRRYNLPETLDPSIKDADNILLVSEAIHLMNKIFEIKVPYILPAHKLLCYKPFDAKNLFLARYYSLVKSGTEGRRGQAEIRPASGGTA